MKTVKNFDGKSSPELALQRAGGWCNPVRQSGGRTSPSFCLNAHDICVIRRRRMTARYSRKP